MLIAYPAALGSRIACLLRISNAEAHANGNNKYHQHGHWLCIILQKALNLRDSGSRRYNVSSTSFLYVHPFLHPHCGLRKKRCKSNHFLNTDYKCAEKKVKM